MLYAMPDTLLKVALNTNKLVTMQYAPIKWIARLYVITDILLIVALSTNKTGDQVLHYTSHIF